MSWDQLERARRGERSAPEPAFDEKTRHALERLTQTPEWQVLLDHYHQRLWSRTASEAGALLELEGRRNHHRELEKLAKKVADDRSGRKPGSE